MKKYNPIYIALLLASLFLFTACEKEIEFKGEQKAPFLVLNGFIAADSAVSVHLSQSKFILSDKPGFEEAEGAQVELYVNGTAREKLVYAGNGVYRGTYRPRVKDVIEIKASANGFESMRRKPRFPTIPCWSSRIRPWFIRRRIPCR